MRRFREVLVNGDLYRQRPAWFLFGEWENYRNLSEEARIAKERMDNYFMAYKSAQHDFIVVQKNVQMNIDALRLNKLDNSDSEIILSQDTSIFEEREGVKYSSGRNNNNKGGNNNNGGGKQDNQQKQQQQQQKKKNGQNHTVSLTELLLGAKITVPVGSIH